MCLSISIIICFFSAHSLRPAQEVPRRENFNEDSQSDAQRERQASANYGKGKRGFV